MNEENIETQPKIITAILNQSQPNAWKRKIAPTVKIIVCRVTTHKKSDRQNIPVKGFTGIRPKTHRRQQERTASIGGVNDPSRRNNH